MLQKITTANGFHTDMGLRVFEREHVQNYEEKQDAADYPYVAFRGDGFQFSSPDEGTVAGVSGFSFSIYAYGLASTSATLEDDLTEDLMTALGPGVFDNDGLTIEIESGDFTHPDVDMDVLLLSMNVSVNANECWPTPFDVTWL